MRPLVPVLVGLGLIVGVGAESSQGRVQFAGSAKPRSFVLCYRADGSGTLLRQRPKSCPFALQNGTLEGLYIRKMHWHGWGTIRATTKGTALGEGVRRKVRVTLYHRYRCPGLGLLYDRMKVPALWHSPVKLRICAG